MSSTGQVTAHSTGVTQLSATYQGLTATSALTVSQDSDVQSLTIEGCGGAVLVGMTEDCTARVQVDTAVGSIGVSDQTTWTSSAPSVVSVVAGGHVSVQSTGQVQISATYHGKTAAMTFSASDATQDGVTCCNVYATGGQFYSGGTAEVAGEVGYSVVSASSGRLFLRAYDQSNLVAASAEMTVPHGSNTQYLSLTFTVPTASTRICWAAYLTIGNSTLVAPTDPLSGPPLALCVPVTQLGVVSSNP